MINSRMKVPGSAGPRGGRTSRGRTRGRTGGCSAGTKGQLQAPKGAAAAQRRHHSGSPGPGACGGFCSRSARPTAHAERPPAGRAAGRAARAPGASSRLRLPGTSSRLHVRRVVGGVYVAARGGAQLYVHGVVVHVAPLPAERRRGRGLQKRGRGAGGVLKAMDVGWCWCWGGRAGSRGTRCATVRWRAAGARTERMGWECWGP